MSGLGDEEVLPPPIKVSVSKKRRNLPGCPDPDAEVIALSPKSLLTTNRFVCEICSKGFQRDQNLQLHRRGHNLPWRLKQKESHEYRKKVYICPELNCVHHDPARALGDLTGIKKHFSRKHGEKKWNCDKCSKRYAVHSDWKAHQKTCGTKEYRCDCGYLFSRKDSFMSHRAFCDVLDKNKDPPCNDGQSTKPAANSDEINNKDTIMSNMPASMDAAASPASPVPSGNGPTYTEIQEPISAESVPDPAIPESGIASLPSTCMQGDIGANNCRLNQGSELSLGFGSNCGPGPPSNAQVIGTHNTSVPICGFPTARDPNKLEFPQLASSESQGRSKHVPSKGAMGMLASLFLSSAHRQSGVDGCGSLANAFPIPDQDSFLRSAGLSSSSTHGPSKASLHNASAATSATALLQKAAELGAKASNPCMFECYGTVGRDSNLSRDTTPRELSCTGLSDSYLISLQSKAGQSEDYVKSNELHGSTSLSGKVADSLTVGSSYSVCYPGSSPLNLPFQVHVHGNSSALSKHAHIKRNSNVSTKLCGSSFGEKGCRARQECGAAQISESEKQMVDFLGVNLAGTLVGRSSASMDRLLPHRDLESMTAGIRATKKFHYPSSSIG